MNFEIPTKEEIKELVVELDSEFENVFPEDFEINKEGFALTFFKAIKICFEDFPEEGYTPLSTYSETGEEHQNQSSVNIIDGNDGHPYFNVKVVRDDGSWVFNGYVEFERFFGYFTGITFQYLKGIKKENPKVTEVEFEEQIINVTLDVFVMALRRLPKWIEIMIDSFQNKIELIWGKYLYEDIKKKHHMKGIEVQKLDVNASRQNTLRSLESKIREFIGDDTGFETYLLRLKKKNLALQYKNIFSHWNNMQDMQLKGVDWTRYIRAGDMSDITDDLIKAFEKGTKIGDLALEQSARRAELYNNVKLTKKSQNLRANGVMCSGYGRSNLYKFKKDGEKFIEEDNEASPNDKNSDWTGS